MRCGFVTCVQLGLSCMEAIYESGGSLDLIMTLEDDMAKAKSGRIYVDEFAAKHDVPVAKVRNINKPDAIEALAKADLDWLFIIGWSQIAREDVLALPSKGVIGMHPTLLPVGRGRAAIPWAILKRLEKTGVTLFKMDSGVDTGPILAQTEVPMHPQISAAELYNDVETAHVTLINDAFPKLASGKIEPVEQDHSKATEWPGRKPEDGAIDVGGSVHEAECLIRAVTHPYPGAFVENAEGRLIVWRAEIATDDYTGPDQTLAFPDGRLRILESELDQPEG